jgi:aromatic-L-amino-acid decarboxylase
MHDSEANRATGDMSPEEFRRQGYRIIDWIAEYLAHPERYPVLSRVRPGEVRDQLPASAPREPESYDAIMRDLDQIIAPGVTHWNHPAFFAYFSISGSGPGILGELLSAAFNVNGMLWKTCPSATELEERVLDWLRQMLGLEGDWFGEILDTASVASLIALAAAREAADLEVRVRGMAGRDELERLRIYTSVEAHSSIEKGAIVLGIGQQGVRKIPTDDAFRMDATALARAIDEDLAAGWRPLAVVACVGTTSTTSIDPIPAIAELCAAHDLWLHVDAAYGGSAAIVPEMREVLAGCERADSLVVNPHKWLFTPIDCSAFYCRRPDVLHRTFSLVPEYLRTGEDQSVTNLMDYGISLGRRFRALKLWLVLRTFGSEGMIARLRDHVRMARDFAGWVEQADDFELMAPVPFSLVCFRAAPVALRGDDAALDRLNQALLDAVNATGEVYLSHTRLRDRLTLRLAIGNIRTTDEHVSRARDLLQEHATRLVSQM